jgi:Cu(I)/Ag(I) efflux system membrane fusion protein
VAVLSSTSKAISNTSGMFKPEMFVTGIVKARLDEYINHLVIPKSAVLWTGPRSIVYVKQTGTDEPLFKLREIGLGPMLGNSYVVTDGLEEGEEIVTQGAFSVDAAAQLEGKPSMMNVSQSFTREIDKNTEASFKVSGNCEMCKARIEKAAKSVRGLNNAVWDMQTKTIRVEYNEKETRPDDIQRAIAKSGHDTEKFKADDTVYNSLPGCCLYRK